MDRATLEKLSKKQLIDIILDLYNEILILKSNIKRLTKDSATSSKPPSTDIKKNHKDRSLRKKSNRKPGGQKGHKGNTRPLEDNPNKIVRCELKKCKECGLSLESTSGEIVGRRQERDIPPIEPDIIEYQQIEKECSCGCKNKGEFPKNITAPVQIGDNAKAFIIYLYIQQILPFKRLKQLSEDLLGFPISTRSIENIIEEVTEKNTKLYKNLTSFLKTHKWTGSDETGMRVQKKRWWLWIWQNIKATYYTLKPSRGYAVVEEHFGEDYTGTLVHDCWSAQNNTKAKGGHQQCHEHIKRDLKFLIKDCRSKWSYRMMMFLYKSEKARDKLWEKGFDNQLRREIINQYKKKFLDYLEAPVIRADEKRLQKRLIKHQNSILLFMKDPDIPYHNNGSEQGIRIAKIKHKISGCFRSKRGAYRYAVLLSLIETCKKQNLVILKSIKQMVAGTLQFQLT